MRRLRLQLDAAASRGMGVVLHVGHDLPRWAVQEHPELAGRPNTSYASTTSATSAAAAATTTTNTTTTTTTTASATAASLAAAAAATKTNTYGEQRSALLQQHGVAYDIDHPLAKRMLRGLLPC